MIKKFVLVFAVFLMLCSVNALALQVDDDFYVYGQNNEELCEVIDMTAYQLKEYCETNNITFLAVNKTNTKQIRKTEFEDGFSKKIGNLLALEEQEILALTEDLTGFSDVTGTVLEEGNKCFLKIEVKTEDSGGEYILTQYITVADSKKEILTFYTDADASTDYIEEAFASQFKASSTASALKIISIVGIVLFSILALVVIIAIIKDTFTKKPTE